MTKVDFKYIARTFITDIIIWFTLPAIFLSFYLKFTVAKSGAIIAHLQILLYCFLVMCVLRLLLALLSINKKIRNGVIAFTCGSFGLLLTLYYALVLIGLDAWGHVVSWNLIHSYVLQTPQLADVLGISQIFAFASLIFIWAIFVFVSRQYLRYSDWPTRLIYIAKQRNIQRVIVVCIVGVTSITSLSLWGTFAYPARETGEPIITTFFPKEGMRGFSGFSVDAKGSEKIDRANDAARSSYQPNPSANRRNLVLIVVDALRPDHLSAYGYARKTTPYLDQLMESKNVNTSIRLVKNMRSTCSESACGLFSMASSRYFHEVSERPFTLQQALKSHGYVVKMILGGDHTNFYGLRSLYGEVDSFIDGSSPSAAYANADRWVIDQTKALSSWEGTPTMIQYHLMSAHPLGTREPAFKKFLPYTNYSLSITRPTLKRENAVNYYDNGVLQTDDVIKNLLQTLHEKKYLDNALVIITADHGEALGEHGQYSHANGLRESTIKIPFFAISFGYDPDQFSTLKTSASQVDIAPTILTEFNMPVPSIWRGKPMQSDQWNDITYLQQGDQIGLIDHRNAAVTWKYWREIRSGKEFVYRINSDLAEEHNLVAVPAYSSLIQEWRRKIFTIRPVADAR